MSFVSLYLTAIRTSWCRTDLLYELLVGGIDRDGTGAVYSFDPVGSYERESCRAAGAAQSLVQPFLDAMVRENRTLPLGNLLWLERKIKHADYEDRFIFTRTLTGQWQESITSTRRRTSKIRRESKSTIRKSIRTSYRCIHRSNRKRNLRW